MYWARRELEEHVAGTGTRTTKRSSSDSEDSLGSDDSDYDPNNDETKDQHAAKKAKLSVSDKPAAATKPSVVDGLETASLILAPAAAKKPAAKLSVVDSLETASHQPPAAKKPAGNDVGKESDYATKADYMKAVRQSYYKKPSTTSTTTSTAVSKPVTHVYAAPKNKNGNRAVGDFPRTDKQQLDWQCRQQFKLTLKNEMKMQRMMTPRSLTDEYVSVGSEEAKNVEANEAAWPVVLPLKGMMTEMMPNKEGSAPLIRLHRPKITLLAPSKARGNELERVIRSGAFDLEIVTTADDLLAAIGPQSKTKDEEK